MGQIAKHLEVAQYAQVVKTIALQRKVVAGAYRPISMGSVKLGIWQVHSEIMLIVKKRGTLVGSGLRQVCVFL